MENDTFIKVIGENIVRIRKEQNLTQKELSYRLDIEDSALRRIEKGRTNPTILTLKSIATVLNVNISDLLPTTDTN